MIIGLSSNLTTSSTNTLEDKQPIVPTPIDRITGKGTKPRNKPMIPGIVGNSRDLNKFETVFDAGCALEDKVVSGCRFDCILGIGGTVVETDSLRIIFPLAFSPLPLTGKKAYH